MTNPTLAFHLATISDYSSEMPFIDIARTMRRFGGSGFSPAVDAQYLDANNYPTQMPPGWSMITTIWDGPSGHYQGENYVLTYDGTGTITLGNVASTVSSEAGRIVFTTKNPSSKFWINITATDPGETGDYIRNISVVPEKFEALYNLGEIFNPDFLDLVQDARLLRFMKWMATEDSLVEDWADRPTTTHATWQGDDMGVPVEIMVALCNQIGADPHFAFPPHVTDDYVTQFATYVRDNLACGLVAHYEWGNETWNSAYAATGWIEDQGVAAGWTVGTDFAKGQKWAGYRMAQVMEIIRGLYSEDSGEDRWFGVLGTWPSLDNMTEQRLTGIAYHIDNDVGVPVGTTVAKLFSGLGTTTYFGSSVVGNSTKRTELLDYLDTHTQQEAFTWLAGKLVDASYSGSIPTIVTEWEAQKVWADANGLGLVAYEGGQHVHQSWAITGLTQAEIDALKVFLSAFVRSQQMADLYQTLWNEWKNVSAGPFMQFEAVGLASDYGSWGLYADLFDSNPRATLLRNLNSTETPWWTDTAGRTSMPDPKIVKINSGGGKHRREVGASGCVIDGDASGQNVVIMPGAPADYTCARDGTDTALYTYTHTSSGKVYKQRNCQAVGWSG